MKFGPISDKVNSFSTSLSVHRIIEQFDSEGTFKANLVQAPYNDQGHLQLGRVAQSLQSVQSRASRSNTKHRK